MYHNACIQNRLKCIKILIFFLHKNIFVIPESESSHDNFMVNISQCAIEKIIHHISGYFYFCNKKHKQHCKIGEKTPLQESTVFLKILQEWKERIIWKLTAHISISSHTVMSVIRQYVNNFFQWVLIYFSSTFHLPPPTHSPIHLYPHIPKPTFNIWKMFTTIMHVFSPPMCF